MRFDFKRHCSQLAQQDSFGSYWRVIYCIKIIKFSIFLPDPAQERLQQKLEKQEMLQAAKQAKKERGKKFVQRFVKTKYETGSYAVFICNK